MNHSPAAVLLATVLLATLTGCGDGESDRVLSTGSASPAAPSVAASADPEPTESFRAGTGTDTEEPTGGPLSVVAVRVANQDGYDRVVFELDGDVAGEPGWRVEYTDDPAQQGSGEAVEVGGSAALAVFITGVGYPMDTGAAEVTDDPALPSDLTVIEDVVLGATFEGQYEAFIGTAREAPFRVFRLSDPARVVIDVQNS